MRGCCIPTTYEINEMEKFLFLYENKSLCSYKPDMDFLRKAELKRKEALAKEGEKLPTWENIVLNFKDISDTEDGHESLKEMKEIKKFFPQTIDYARIQLIAVKKADLEAFMKRKPNSPDMNSFLYKHCKNYICLLRKFVA